MADKSAYVMGHDDRERRRLRLQATILNPLTEQLFARAGICAGMQVLDIGCGVGDVSLIAARLLGRNGRVTAIDIDAVALETLKARAAAQGVENIDGVQADIQTWKPDRKFDAVVGRHILIHTKDALAVLRSCAAMLQPRGLAVFQEYDFSILHNGWPATPTRDQLMEIFNKFFAKVSRSNQGSRLWTLLLDAGFEQPNCRAEYAIDGGPESVYYEWLAESLRSLLPPAIALGIVAEGEIDIDAIEQRAREETVSNKSGFPAPAMVGAFARLRA